MKVRQHIPSFCDGSPVNTADVNSTAELLALPWVQTWSEHSNFKRFSLSDSIPPPLLMAEMTDSYWVVAYLEKYDWDLPKWSKT